MRASRVTSIAVTVGMTIAVSTVVPRALPAQQDDKPRIAVVDFRNSSTWHYWGPRLGQAAADELATQLVQTGEFTVIERDRLQSLLAEQRLGQSGAVEASTAAEIGQLLGVQAILTGSITQFSINRKGGGLRRFAASYSVAEAVADVRLVDTNTGEILLATEGTGKKRLGGARFKNVDFHQTYDAGIAQEALRPAIEKAVEELVALRETLASLEPQLPPGKIIGSNDERHYIDRGENFGIEPGQRFDVYRVVDEIRDADGELLDRLTKKVGVLEVSRVLSQSSICDVVSGEAREGDEVRAPGSESISPRADASSGSG